MSWKRWSTHLRRCASSQLGSFLRTLYNNGRACIFNTPNSYWKAVQKLTSASDWKGVIHRSSPRRTEGHRARVSLAVVLRNWASRTMRRMRRLSLVPVQVPSSFFATVSPEMQMRKRFSVGAPPVMMGLRAWMPSRMRMVRGVSRSRLPLGTLFPVGKSQRGNSTSSPWKSWRIC